VSGARSKDEVIREMYERAMSDDEDGMVELLAPEFELDVTSYVFNPAVWRGREGAREWLRQAREVWDTPHYDLERLEDLGGDRALTAVVLRGRARQSGLEVEIRQWHLWTVHDGLVVHTAHYAEEEAARRAAGLSAPSS
jgi:ketosteroid isomerase-like protein